MAKIRRIIAVLSIIGTLLAIGPAAQADAGGGPGSNVGCPGHQPPPPPGGGCG